MELGKKQNQKNIHPKIKVDIKDVKQYDTIFLGYPIWHYTIPVAVVSFLEKYDLAGKNIIVFGSAGGSNLEDTFKTVAKYQPKAKIRGGLNIGHRDILDADVPERLDKWLDIVVIK